ncbi:hypothetical protein [Oceanirhabdus sp. W0125-5]|uniref:hypothetical protein n=1 Tax=Oceanirhabdus sp. W0125-5 TaxID=2999116 RepID=UPI0022F34554|nr:hypothetical protein [Oceanirhabdus sp. W0125-5]WBW96837.1 hypothetical protein OW730_24575 [Oceanirhabdus sp. W0125-5]
MFNIQDIMSENFSGYPEETQEFMKKYNEKIRENLKEELINDIGDNMLKDMDKGKDNFISMLSQILNNGWKGFNKMSTQALLNMYLERKSQEDFFKLIEKVNKEV